MMDAKHNASLSPPALPFPTASVWLQALRLHTLPLAVAGMLAGAMLAWQQQVFQTGVFAASLSTALLLQIFSNLANDYGDAANGADHRRHGKPARAVASGLITPVQMRRALWLCALLCCASGLWLLAVALPALNGLPGQWWLWVVLGGLCLLAAWAYTAGRHPYGYAGLGDMAVWLFFGLVAVLGSSTLYGAQTDLLAAAVANALGLWCAAVLNINNMRDIHTDLAAGKHTIAAQLGGRAALFYHTALLVLAALCWGIWSMRHLPAPLVGGQIILSLLLYGHHLRRLLRARQRVQAAGYNRQLAQLSLFVLLWTAANWLLLWWLQAA